MKKFGLIGFPLTHSFSKKYFTEKFADLGISVLNQYDLYELPDILSFPELLIQNSDLLGINVTIPHKVNVMQFLTDIDPAAKKIGAVNVIKVNPDKTLRGFNSDYYGFKRSVEEFIGLRQNIKALVLGNGGAAKAVIVALEDLEIEFKLVSRTKNEGTITYDEANALLPTHHLLVNTSPLGTYPNVDMCPALDYDTLTPEHFLHDLVYNPEVTLFMANGLKRGAKAKNGYEMLVHQAEKSWEIRNS